jgi:hypothetical protein
MHPVLAESLNGWLFAALVFFGGLAASILALGALVPARRRNRRLTIALSAPAFIVGLLVTLGTGYGFITDGMRDPDYSIRDFAMPWLVMAGPAFGTSLLAMLVLWFSSRRTPDA